MAFVSSIVSTFAPFSPSTIVGDNNVMMKKPSFYCSMDFSKKWGGRDLRVFASSANVPLTGVIFEPFEEVKNFVLAVPSSPQVSLARQKYADECESAIKEQIK